MTVWDQLRYATLVTREYKNFATDYSGPESEAALGPWRPSTPAQAGDNRAAETVSERGRVGALATLPT